MTPRRLYVVEESYDGKVWAIAVVARYRKDADRICREHRRWDSHARYRVVLYLPAGGGR